MIFISVDFLERSNQILVKYLSLCGIDLNISPEASTETGLSV